MNTISNTTNGAALPTQAVSPASGVASVRTATSVRTEASRKTMHVKGDLDPYAEIEKAPLYTPDRMRSRGYSVRLEDDGADDGWREVGLVSEDYLLVPNADVRGMAHEVGARSGLRFEEARTFFDGKRYALALAARSEAVHVEVEVGDYVSLGMLFENSYDGSCRLTASLFAYRLACKNGMLAGDLFARVRFRHSRESRGWEDELARSLAMLAGAQSGLRRFADGSARLARHRLGTAELAAIRTRYLDRLPVTLWGKVVDRYLAARVADGVGPPERGDPRALARRADDALGLQPQRLPHAEPPPLCKRRDRPRTDRPRSRPRHPCGINGTGARTGV